jgi:hypothetical protein
MTAYDKAYEISIKHKQERITKPKIDPEVAKKMKLLDVRAN